MQLDAAAAQCCTDEFRRFQNLEHQLLKRLLHCHVGLCTSLNVSVARQENQQMQHSWQLISPPVSVGFNFPACRMCLHQGDPSNAYCCKHAAALDPFMLPQSFVSWVVFTEHHPLNCALHQALLAAVKVHTHKQPMFRAKSMPCCLVT